MIEKYEAEQTEKGIRELINRTKIGPSIIWQVRRQARGNNELEYNTITEEGKEITNPEETKEHIETYFENLCQARPGTQEYEESTRMITVTMKNTQQQYTNPGTEYEPIVIQEVNGVIKNYKGERA